MEDKASDPLIRAKGLSIWTAHSSKDISQRPSLTLQNSRREEVDGKTMPVLTPTT